MTGMLSEPIAKRSDKRGLPLLEEVIEEIEAHPATWNQVVWLDRDSLLLKDMDPAVRESLVPSVGCGTTACLFGHVVFKAGAQLEIRRDFGAPEISSDAVLVGGVTRSIEAYAAGLLNLDWDHSEWLSNSGRSWEDILEFRDAWRLDAAEGPDVTDHRDDLVYDSET